MGQVKRSLAAATILALAVFGLSSPATADDPPGTGSIVVTLTNHWNGAPSTGGCVAAIDSSDAVAATDCAGSGGIYMLAGLGDGNFRLEATDFEGAAATQYSGGASDLATAAEVVVASGGSTAHPFTVYGPHTLLGMVVDATATPQTTGTVELWSSAGRIDTSSLDAAGKYALDGSLCSVWCRVLYVDGLAAPTWYPDSATYAGAQDVVTSASGVTVLQDLVATALPSSATGNLWAPHEYDSSTICVVAMEALGGGVRRTAGVACGAYASAFTIDNLGATTYTLCVVNAPSAPHGCATPSEFEFVGGNATPTEYAMQAGTSASVSTPFDQVLNVTLSYDARNTSGCVDVYDSSEQLLTTRCFTALHGVAQPIPVPAVAGGYRLHLQNFSPIIDVWQTVSSSQVFTSNPPGSPPSASIYVPTPSFAPFFRGTITVPAGYEGHQLCVLAVDEAGLYAEAPYDLRTCANASGFYRLSVPPNGRYRLQFYSDSDDLAIEWNGDAATYATAPFRQPVGAGLTINATLGLAGSISGTVRDAGGQPVADGCVRLFLPSGAFAAMTCVDEAGEYRIASLASRDYIVQYDGGQDYDVSWWGGSDLESATPVTVSVGDESVVDLVGISLATISGTVMYGSSSAALDGCVEAYTYNAGYWTWVNVTCDVVGGAYELKVPAGTYRLHFFNFESSAGTRLNPQWWSSAFDVSGAAAVVVAAGADITANAQLSGTSGRIMVTTDALDINGAPLAAASLGGCAQVYSVQYELVAFECADEAGTVVLDIRPGQYKVRVTDFSYLSWGSEIELAPQWVGGKYAFDLAPTYTVTAGTTVTLHQDLMESRGLRGVVSNWVSGPQPITDGFIELYDVDTGDFIGSSTIDAGGNYWVQGVIPGGSGVHLFLAQSEQVPNQYLQRVSYPPGPQALFPAGIGTVQDFSVETGGRMVSEYFSPFFFDGGEVCATAWLEPDDWHDHGPYPDLSGFTWERTECGAPGAPLDLGPLTPGEYVISFEDSSGHWFWYRQSAYPWEVSILGVGDGSIYPIGSEFLTLEGNARYVPGNMVTLTARGHADLDGYGVVWYRDGAGPWTETTTIFQISNGVGSFSVKPVGNRTYGVYAVGPTPYAGAEFVPFPSTAFTFEAVTPSVSRVGGESRYDVAVGISQEYFPAGADTVYVATGANFPDALGAAPAAALRGAPLLLVPGTTIPASVQAELERLDPDTIIVTGGPASVSAGVLAQLGTYASTVVRINGDDRYEVSRLVTRDAFEGVGSDVAYIATGATFPDALSASAAAGSVDAPVILVYGLAATLDSQTRQLLIDLGVTEIRIAGGPASVSPGIETGLRNVPGVTTVSRLSGDDRFVVSGATNRAAFTSADTVFIASGYTFPDALAGAAVAGAEGAPLYVIPSSCIPGYVLDDIASFGATTVKIFGGPASVTPAAAALARC